MKVDYLYKKYIISLTVLKGSYNPMRMLEYDASLNNAAPVPLQSPVKPSFLPICKIPERKLLYNGS